MFPSLEILLRRCCNHYALFLLLFPFGIVSAAEREILTAPVRVVSSSDPEIFHESWRKAPVQAMGAAVAESQVDRVSEIFKRAFAKYPDGVLGSHLKTVYVLSELSYSSVTAAGTNSRSAVYVKVGDIQNGYTDMSIENTFHAELSSILLREEFSNFDADAWQKLNPGDFKYSAGDGVGAIKAGLASLRWDETLHQKGFLNLYAQSSLENDFNGYAAAIFIGDKRLWDLAEKHVAINGKLAITIAFYQSIHPSWTVERLREFATK